MIRISKGDFDGFRASYFIYLHSVGGIMDDYAYVEKSPILPRMLTYVLSAVLLATLACMAVTSSSLPAWMLTTTAAVFIAVIAVAFWASLSVEVTSEKVVVRYIVKTYEVTRDMILDKRCGELGEIRSYSNWSLKGVKHQNFARVGEDEGVALKIKGMRVMTISSANHEELFSRIPVEDKEDQDA